MPLSEDEQRILSQIEQQLYETDPSLAHGIADTTVYSDASRHLKQGIFGFVAGLVFMIATIPVQVAPPALPIIGVVVMFLSALRIESSARRMGKAGIDQLTQTMRSAGLRDYLGNRSGRMKDRFRKDES